MNSSIIHDNICSVIHKKCHSKNYHSDVKYHTTLNGISSVACDGHIRYCRCWKGIACVHWGESCVVWGGPMVEELICMLCGIPIVGAFLFFSKPSVKQSNNPKFALEPCGRETHNCWHKVDLFCCSIVLFFVFIFFCLKFFGIMGEAQVQPPRNTAKSGLRIS